MPTATNKRWYPKALHGTGGVNYVLLVQHVAVAVKIELEINEIDPGNLDPWMALETEGSGGL